MKRAGSAWMAAGAAFWWLGCAGPQSHDSVTLLDLRPGLEPPATAGAADTFYRSLPVARRGRVQDARVLVAPTRVRAPLAGLSGEYVLECEAAPVYNVGDGLRMTVILYSPRDETLVFERFFDAGRVAGDRAWIRLRIPLDLTAGDAEALEIRVDPGPHGDKDGDWLALTGPWLARKKTE